MERPDETDALGSPESAAPEIGLVDLEGFKALKREHTTVVYFLATDRLLVWVIGKGGIHFIQTEVSFDKLRGKVQALQSLMTAPSLRPQDAPVPERTASQLPSDRSTRPLCRELYDILWSSVEPHIPTGDRVCIIPHQYLHYVPFQALHDGKKHLIEQHDLYYAPSASALCLMAKRKVLSADTLVVLDPLIAKRKDLSFGETETLSIRTLYPHAQILFREDAKIAAFQKLAPISSLIHFSCHGHFDPWIPMRSGLHLATGKPKEDEILRAREIYQLRLPRTQLVVMSACVSSLGDLAGGDEVTGLTRAFQTAGVPNVIGSLWLVSNEATTRLLTFFYEELRKAPLDPVTALCAAQRRALLHDPNPAYWAAFQVSGCGKIQLVHEK